MYDERLKRAEAIADDPDHHAWPQIANAVTSDEVPPVLLGPGGEYRRPWDITRTNFRLMVWLVAIVMLSVGWGATIWWILR